MPNAQFEKDYDEYLESLQRRGRRSGPRFQDHVLVWHDQVFGREIEPAGAVNCPQALRVGATNNSLGIALVASNANEGPLLIPAGSTITLSLAQGDRENGTFEEVGPTICVKAPTSGLEVNADGLICRFPIGNTTKPWLKCTLEFSGAITGGTVDCALVYMPR